MDHSNYIITDLFKGKASDFGAWSGLTPGHENLTYHQIVIVSSGSLAAGVYNVRMIVGEDNSNLETTAYTGKQLSIASSDSARATFFGFMRGVHLEVSVSLSGGETISCVLMSSANPLGSLEVDGIHDKLHTHDGSDGSGTVSHLNLSNKGTKSHATLDTEVAANTTHKTSDGSDHSFIDQEVTSGSSPVFAGANITGISAANVSIATGVGSPTVDRVQEYLDNTGSSGFFLGGALSDGGSGTLDVAAGSGFIRTTNDDNAELQSFKWSASAGIAVADNTTQYVYVDDAGAISLSTDEFLETPDLILIGVVTDEAGAIESVFSLGVRLEESIGHAGRFLRRVHGVTRDNRKGGLIFGQSGDANRDVTMSEGILWWGRTEYPITIFNTSGADTFSTYSAGGQENATASQWPNAQYDNAGTLTTLTSNKWANLFFFVEPDDHIVMVYGRAQFNSQVLAEGEGVPATSLPSRITETGVLAARFTFKKSENTAIISISADFDAVFVGVGVTETIVGISGTKAEFDTAVTDGNIQYVGDAPTSHTILSHDTDTTGAELTALADNSIADALHRHSELVASDGSPDPALSMDDAGNLVLAVGNVELASGAGIDFSLTSDAAGSTSELFDDHEKGTWTPKLQDSSLSDAESQTYLFQQGNYQKDGNTVFFKCRVKMTDLGSLAVGDGARLVGLPYTPSATAQTISSAYVGSAIGLAVGTAGYSVSGYILTGEPYIRLRLWDLTTGNSDLLFSELTNTTDFIIAGHYEV